MRGKFLRMWMVLTVITALFAATGAWAAPTKVAKPKKISAAGGTRTVTYAVTEQTVVATASDTWLQVVSVTPDPIVLVDSKATVTVNYTVSPKTTAGIRTGQILVNGQPAVTIEQSGAACKMKPALNSTKFEFYGGEKSFDFTLPEGCTLETAADPWITATIEGRTVTVKVAELEVNKTKNGKIKFTVKDGNKVSDKKVHTVLQSKRTSSVSVRIGDPTQITDVAQASKAAGSVVAASKTVMNAGEQISEGTLDAVGEASATSTRSVQLLSSTIQKLKPAGLLAAPSKVSGSEDCLYGGTITYNVGSSSASFTFDGCKQDGVEMNGVLSVSGSGEPDSETGAKGTIKAGKSGVPFSVITYSDAYQTVASASEMLLTLEFSNLKFNPETEVLTFATTANGYIDNQFKENEQQMKLLLDVKNFKLALTQPAANVTQASADGLLRSTVFSGETLVASLELALDNYTITVTEDELFGTSSIALNGGYAIKSYPTASCTDGTFYISTDPTAPIIYNESTDAVTGGKIMINGVAVEVGSEGATTIDLTNSGLNLQPGDNINTVCTIN